MNQKIKFVTFEIEQTGNRVLMCGFLIFHCSFVLNHIFCLVGLNTASDPCASDNGSWESKSINRVLRNQFWANVADEDKKTLSNFLRWYVKSVVHKTKSLDLTGLNKETNTCD